MEKQRLEQIDSHLSMGTNSIIFSLLTELTRRSLEVKDSPTIPNIKALKNVTEEFMEFIYPIISEKVLNNFEDLSQRFDNIYYDLMDQKKPMTLRTLAGLQFMVKNMRFMLTTHLQKYKFLWRVSSLPEKGLHRLPNLIHDNIFT